MNKETKNEHFKNFHDVLAVRIARFWDGRPGQTMKGDLLEIQREQVEGLINLEHEFKLALIKDSRGIIVYRKFVEYICVTKGNILDARPYFRERQGVFKDEISVTLKAGRARALYRFRFNYRFIHFALGAVKWAPGSRVVKIANKIKALRDTLVTTNLPLACKRAREFFNKTPRSHLEHMDLVQIACEGLLSAVDKFTPPFCRAFRAVIIGRISGNMIEQYNETLVHFYPREKRQLYRLHKHEAKNAGPVDFKAAAAAVNKGDGKKAKRLKGAQRTSEMKLACLAAASSVLSAETLTNDAGEQYGPSTRTIERYAAPVDTQPDFRVERQDSLDKLKEAAKHLSIRQRKILVLRGIAEDSLY